MFQSVAHVVLALLALLVKTADASFDGPPIKFNIYGGGGLVPCQESDITITGETTKLFVLETAVEEDALCEHDVLYHPDGTNFTAYTKLHNIECTADVMELEIYTCFDEACRNCSSSMDVDAFVTTSHIKAVLEDPFTCFEMFNATDNGTASGAFSEFYNHIDSMSAQHRYLDTENDQDAVAEYWNYLFEKSCGVEWLAEVTASTAVSTADASFVGPPIKYNIYGGGLVPCPESNITMTGETTKLFLLEDAEFCEHDVLYQPDGTTMTTYTKLQTIECKADVMEMQAYNCFDEACRNCSSSLDTDAFVTTSNIKAVLEDPFGCFELLHETDNVTVASGSNSELFNIESNSASRFLDTENDQDAVAEYWNYFFENSCGVEWLAEVTASTASSMMVKYGSPILGSVFSAVAMAVAIVVAV